MKGNKNQVLGTLQNMADYFMGIQRVDNMANPDSAASKIKRQIDESSIKNLKVMQDKKKEKQIAAYKPKQTPSNGIGVGH